MTPNEQTNATGIETRGDNTRLGAIKAAGTICLLAGVWFFVSPWVYGAAAQPNAWNSWIIGGFMVLFGILRISRPAYSTALSWCNMVLGIWTFFSPWIYGYTGNGRFIKRQWPRGLSGRPRFTGLHSWPLTVPALFQHLAR